MMKNVEDLSFGDYVHLEGMDFCIESVVHREIDVSVRGMDGETLAVPYDTQVRILR